MKSFFTTSIYLFISALCFAQGVEFMDKDRTRQNKIKTQTLYEYDYAKGKPESKGTRARIAIFDTKGNRIEETNYRASGSVHYIVSFKYDGTGNKTEYAQYSGDEKKLNYKQNIKFDSKGNKLMETGFNGGQNFKTIYNYNKDNRLVEVNYFIVNNITDKDGNIIRSDEQLDEKRVFTNTGNTASIKVLDRQGSVKYTQVNTYSESGKVLEEVKTENNSVVARKIVYTYDNRDNLTSETKYVGVKQIGKITRVYNTQGKLVEVYQEFANTPKFLTNKYTYNEKGWLIEEQSRSEANKDFSKNTYSYDENGICKTIDSYYATYKTQVLSVFAYEYY